MKNLLNHSNYTQSLIVHIAALVTFSAAFVSYPVHAQFTDDEGDEKDAPYVPTPDHVVERMIEMAEVDSSDYVIDLGSGDGRIVIEAAKTGASGHGVEIDPEMNAMARENADEVGVEDYVMFLKQDLFKTDFEKASVVTMYLWPSIMDRLLPKLLQELEPGSRIVSHDFNMRGWEPDRKDVVYSDTLLMSSIVLDKVLYEPKIRYRRDSTSLSANMDLDVKLDTEVMFSKPDPNFAHKRSHDIYLWVVPADAEGTWDWKVNGESFTMELQQKYQNIDIMLTNENNMLEVDDAFIDGRRLKFEAVNSEDDKRYVFNGRVEGASIEGYIQVHEDSDQRVESWEAERN